MCIQHSTREGEGSKNADFVVIQAGDDEVHVACSRSKERG
jgi:hypothetical protein